MVRAEATVLAAVAARPHQPRGQRHRKPGLLPSRSPRRLTHLKPCRLRQAGRAADRQVPGERNLQSLHLHLTGGAGRIMVGTDKGALTQIGGEGPSPVGKATKKDRAEIGAASPTANGDIMAPGMKPIARRPSTIQEVGGTIVGRLANIYRHSSSDLNIS